MRDLNNGDVYEE